MFTIATMELKLLKFYKIPEKLATRCFWILPVPERFNLYFILCCEFWSLPLRMYACRICTKYWPRPKNFMFVNSGILLMKDKLSHFAPLSHFSHVTLCCNSSTSIKKPTQFSFLKLFYCNVSWEIRNIPCALVSFFL